MNASRRTGSRARECGLSLVELLVVLFVLGLLAATASVATSGLLEQGQQEATLRTLDAIESAVLGTPDRRDATGHTLVTGFVADIGRLPRALGTDPATALQELWRRPDTLAAGDPWTLPAFAMKAASGDEQVRLPAGWRGPYLDLGVRSVGTLSLLDGWRRPFDLFTDSGAPLTVGMPITGVLSRGADGAIDAVGAQGYDLDQSLVFSRSIPLPVIAPRFQGDVNVVLHSRSATAHALVVRVYSQREGEVSTFQQQLITLLVGADASVLFQGLPIGPKAVRAYVYSGVVAEQDKLPDGTEASRIHHLVVEAGGIPPIVLELP